MGRFSLPDNRFLTYEFYHQLTFDSPRSHLTPNNFYFKVTTIDASNFLESEYPSCELMQYKEEVLSLLEQELSYRGDYFIFSELSGWSANVRKERILDDKYFYEMSVIKLIEDFGPFRIVSYVI